MRFLRRHRQVEPRLSRTERRSVGRLLASFQRACVRLDDKSLDSDRSRFAAAYGELQGEVAPDDLGLVRTRELLVTVAKRGDVKPDVAVSTMSDEEVATFARSIRECLHELEATWMAAVEPRTDATR